MAHFMLQIAYTPEAWAKLVRKPQSRLDAVRSVVERMGGKIESGWMSFGEYDGVVIIEMPDSITAAAFSIAVTAGGAIKAAKTTPLLTFDEGVQAMKQASEAGYQPPGS
jgi:uncharacterized protein with GYD domain